MSDLIIDKNIFDHAVATYRKSCQHTRETFYNPRNYRIRVMSNKTILTLFNRYGEIVDFEIMPKNNLKRLL